jgi:hypothetical protein
MLGDELAVGHDLGLELLHAGGRRLADVAVGERAVLVELRLRRADRGERDGLLVIGAVALARDVREAAHHDEARDGEEGQQDGGHAVELGLQAELLKRRRMMSLLIGARPPAGPGFPATRARRGRKTGVRSQGGPW